MAELKTKPTDASVDEFLAAIEDGARREDCLRIREIMERVTGAKAQMWGDSMVGFGLTPITYATGRTIDWPEVVFASRKRDITLYLIPGLDVLAEKLSRLGKHRLGKGCLYIKRLSDIDLDVLEEVIVETVRIVRTEDWAKQTSASSGKKGS